MARFLILRPFMAEHESPLLRPFMAERAPHHPTLYRQTRQPPTATIGDGRYHMHHTLQSCALIRLLDCLGVGGVGQIAAVAP